MQSTEVISPAFTALSVSFDPRRGSNTPDSISIIGAGVRYEDRQSAWSTSDVETFRVEMYGLLPSPEGERLEVGSNGSPGGSGGAPCRWRPLQLLLLVLRLLLLWPSTSGGPGGGIALLYLPMQLLLFRGELENGWSPICTLDLGDATVGLTSLRLLSIVLMLLSRRKAGPESS